MKLNSVVKSLVLGLAVLVATGAFASNRGSLHVREAVEVNGQQLAPGDYEVRWQGSGANVELTFLKGTKEVAKTSAKEKVLEQAPDYDQAVIDHSNGKAWVSEIQFSGKKKALSLGESDRASMGDSSK